MRSGKDEHVVERRRDVAEHAHQEKGHLQHRVLNKIDAFKNFIVPIGALEISKETNKRQKKSNAQRLYSWLEWRCCRVISFGRGEMCVRGWRQRYEWQCQQLQPKQLDDSAHW